MPGQAIEFIVTGFSKFSGVENNPTEKLVTWLQDYAKQEDFNIFHGQVKVTVRSTRVLRVAAQDVDEYLTTLGQEWNSETNEGLEARPPSNVVLLCLGVAGTAVECRLESRAYNCATFRVPDENGWMPCEQELEPGRGMDFWLGTRLPLSRVKEMLEIKGHNVAISEDAGRYVCNFTYYLACRLAERYPRWETLFVHVPPFEVLEERAQRSFMLDMITAISQSLVI